MQTPNSPTVWIVDDDEDDQLFIRAAFLNGDPSITSLALADGAELLPALAKCDKFPRLILLDINMPRKNGFEALSEIRDIAFLSTLPIIMLTTSSDEEDRQRALQLGANGFLTKPLNHGQLRDMAQRLSQDWELAS